jgi:hypothetical protein
MKKDVKELNIFHVFSCELVTKPTGNLQLIALCRSVNDNFHKLCLTAM